MRDSRVLERPVDGADVDREIGMVDLGVRSQERVDDRDANARANIARKIIDARACGAPTIEAFFLVYHGHRQVPPALRAFIDMIRAPKSTPGARSLRNPF